jgi:mono/diheme cytochrome c family protein
MRVRELVLLTLVAGVAGAQPQPAAPPAGSVAAGRALFLGSRAFEKGGAACGACHALGGEGLAATASLGPELSASLSGMDPEMLDGLLESLPFPSMGPVYAGRALTPAERADLAAYFTEAVKSGPPRGVRRFELFGVLGAGVLLVVPALGARRRKTSSRDRLLALAYGEKGVAR